MLWSGIPGEDPPGSVQDPHVRCAGAELADPTRSLPAPSPWSESYRWRHPTVHGPAPSAVRICDPSGDQPSQKIDGLVRRCGGIHGPPGPGVDHPYPTGAEAHGHVDTVGGEVVEEPAGLRKTAPSDHRPGPEVQQGPTLERQVSSPGQGAVAGHDERRPPVGGQRHARDRSAQLHRRPAADHVEAFSSSTRPVRSLTAIFSPSWCSPRRSPWPVPTRVSVRSLPESSKTCTRPSLVPRAKRCPSGRQDPGAKTLGGPGTAHRGDLTRLLVDQTRRSSPYDGDVDPSSAGRRTRRCRSEAGTVVAVRCRYDEEPSRSQVTRVPSCGSVT